ncbi:MAG: response regulator [Nitrospinota bacterium]|nr:response regulator [Nitrospinota bacterium]
MRSSMRLKGSERMGENAKKTVLLIEDDKGTRETISRIITHFCGHDVVEMESGEDGLKFYKNPQNRFDAIVCDLMLPGISGREIAQYNFEHKKVPLVVLSAFSDAKLGLKLLEYGVEDYLLKPTDSTDFSLIIEKAIERKVKKGSDGYDESLYGGNLASLVISSKMTELAVANSWIATKIEPVVSREERIKFVNFTGEFLLNAHEHGNLNFGEELKAKLLEENIFDMEVSMRESNSNKKVSINISVIKGQIALSITDEGDGFNFERYLSMTGKEISERIEMLNGRGIILGRHYFDKIQYSNGGSTVLLVKNILYKNMS